MVVVIRNLQVSRVFACAEPSLTLGCRNGRLANVDALAPVNMLRKAK